MKVWNCFAGLFLAPLLTALAAAAATADVVPAGLFSRGAVLQRDRRIPVWGAADSGERVTVTLRDQSAVTVAKAGKWSVVLPPIPAGGPYKLIITGHNRVVIPDLLIGDVYICGGESNMEWPLALAAPEPTAVDAPGSPTSAPPRPDAPRFNRSVRRRDRVDPVETQRASDTAPTTAGMAVQDSRLRLYVVPRGIALEPKAEVAGRWQECTPEAASGFSAVAYYFGRSLRRTFGVPIGLIQSAWSGSTAQAWTSRRALVSNPLLQPLALDYERDRMEYSKARALFDTAREKVRALPVEASDVPAGTLPPPDPTRPPSDPTGRSSPTALYNAMIAPLLPYGIRGVIWYQGESNVSTSYQYRTLFPALIADWRKAWGQGDFPFLFVQIAPFLRREEMPQVSALAELRDAQLYASRTVPNTGMAVTVDLGDEQDIHPREKRAVGERLALLARALVYKQDVEASGPVYESVTTEGGALILHFQHTAVGIEARGGGLTGFTVAGEDGVFVPAAAVIRGDAVVVSSQAVAKPVAARYGWADYPQGNLWNHAGLPASPFRTDSFPISTEPATALAPAAHTSRQLPEVLHIGNGLSPSQMRGQGNRRNGNTLRN